MSKNEAVGRFCVWWKPTQFFIVIWNMILFGERPLISFMWAPPSWSTQLSNPWEWKLKIYSTQTFYQSNHWRANTIITIFKRLKKSFHNDGIAFYGNQKFRGIMSPKEMFTFQAFLNEYFKLRKSKQLAAQL